jgi:maltose alpha-D-glucosyltransferase/alpha-amylase
MSAEQSNSSLIIGDAMVLKVIRHLAAGVHPEAEMGRYLTTIGFANTPAMLGEVTRFDTDGTPHTMIMLHRYIHNQGDAWQWTLDTLTRSIQTMALAEPAAAPAPESLTEIFDPQHELMQLADTLGRRLAEMHIALATPTDDPDFSPQLATEEDTRAWADGARAQLEAAFAVLRAKSEWSSEAEARRMAHLLGRRDALLDRIDSLAAAGIGSLRIRIHGDFHLGQVLVAHGDVYIVDFEGEPAKPLAKRREKNCPLRDVAGILRSFDYVAAFAGGSGPGDLSEAVELRKQQFIQQYAPASRAAFLAAYRETVAGLAGFADGEAGFALLQLFVLEKAAYEVCYEAANRPAWVGVPANGMAKLADALLGDAEGET